MRLSILGIVILVLVAGCTESTPPGDPIPPFASIHAGGLSCGLTAEGEAWCWGTNIALGTGQLGEHVVVPTPIPGGLPLGSLSVGLQHVCGVATDGVAYCWGGGALGTGDELFGVVRGVPTPVAGNLPFTQIAAGSCTPAALPPRGTPIAGASTKPGSSAPATWTRPWSRRRWPAG